MLSSLNTIKLLPTNWLSLNTNLRILTIYKSTCHTSCSLNLIPFCLNLYLWNLKDLKPITSSSLITISWLTCELLLFKNTEETGMKYSGIKEHSFWYSLHLFRYKFRMESMSVWVWEEKEFDGWCEDEDSLNGLMVTRYNIFWVRLLWWWDESGRTRNDSKTGVYFC